MSTQDLVTYQTLYRIAEENMKRSGKSMDFTENAFLQGVRNKRGEADLLELVNLDNPSFIQSCYVSFFYRIPDEGAAKRWEREYGLSNQEFQKKVVKSLTNSQEFLDKKVVLKNNIYSDNHTVNYIVNCNITVQDNTNMLETNQAMNRLYGYYKKLPKFLKTIIRRIAGLKD